MRERPEVFFIKSHRPVDAADPAPALYIARDGRDVLVSRAHWLGDNRIGPYCKLPFDQQLRRLVTSENWSKHVRAWRTRSAPTEVVLYEDLLRNSAGTLKRACTRLGVPLPEPTGQLTSWEQLQQKDPVMHRRGKAGSWEDEMPPELERDFWRIHGEQMAALGYPEDEVGRAHERAGAAAG